MFYLLMLPKDKKFLVIFYYKFRLDFFDLIILFEQLNVRKHISTFSSILSFCLFFEKYIILLLWLRQD